MENITYTSYYNKDISYNHKCMKDITYKNTNPQVHNAIELIYLKKGNILYSVDEKSFKLENDFMIITLPGKTHTITFLGSDIYDRYDVLFDEGTVFPAIYEDLKKNIHVINCKGLPVFHELFKKMDFYCGHFKDESLKNLLSHIVDEICYNISVAMKIMPDEQYADNDSVFAKVLSYIDSNLTEGLSLNRISEDLYVSKSYLHSAFRKNLNITPKKYIEMKRLTLAQNKLRRGEGAISASEGCGFSDYSSFYRAYTKHFGYPPSDEKNKSYTKDIIY